MPIMVFGGSTHIEPKDVFIVKTGTKTVKYLVIHEIAIGARLLNLDTLTTESRITSGIVPNVIRQLFERVHKEPCAIDYINCRDTNVNVSVEISAKSKVKDKEEPISEAVKGTIRNAYETGRKDGYAEGQKIGYASGLKEGLGKGRFSAITSAINALIELKDDYTEDLEKRTKNSF